MTNLTDLTREDLLRLVVGDYPEKPSYEAIPGYNVSKAATQSDPVGPSEITNLTNALENEIHELRAVLYSLTDRLINVLPPLDKDSKRDEDSVVRNRDVLSPLGAVLDAYVEDVHNIRNRVVWILDNLRV